MILTKPVTLLILDGWGIAPAWGGNAISQAQTPNFDHLWRQYPHTTLGASGQFVGLPGHEQGNSEVGHLNIGAGRVVWQDSSRINKSIEDRTFFKNDQLIAAFNHAKTNNSAMHLMGLLSSGGIHSHINHLYALLEMVKQQNFSNLFLHLFTDGRDTSPMSGIQHITHLEQKLRELEIGKIASVSGRYYGMDRDHHWDRIREAYNAMVKGIGPGYQSAGEIISTNYRQGRTDEFIIPSFVINNNQPIGLIKNNDAVIFFNFRSDRARQITAAFCADDFREFNRGEKIANLDFVTMIPYGMEQELKLDIKSAFSSEQVEHPLARTISENNLYQFHLAETEKYAHVTYFFNGGKESQFKNEERLMIPSPKVPTFDLKPEMSVYELTNELVKKINSNRYQFIIVNFANADMVGHSGNLKATIEACEAVDQNLGKVYEEVKSKNGILLVTADHGNAEEMLDPKTGEVNTEHSCNPVPFILINGDNIKFLKPNGVLADISPTILRLMNLPKPADMTGEPLFS